jgi:chorismate dehydratase
MSLLRIGAVSFLNAKPLIFGLERAADVDLKLAVPSALLDSLRTAAFDVALLPVIDYQRMPGLRLLTSGGIGCDGPTLTVRIFSPKPLGQTSLVACDTDSHTSVALARILFAELFDMRPRFIDLDARGDNIPADAARLLIGDKVICDEPTGLKHQMDLGEAWKKLTGLPFVFACWTARPDVNLGDLPNRLRQAKLDGLANVESIIAEHAVPNGWLAATARRYLLENLKFDIEPIHLDAIRLFHRLAHIHGVLERPPRELEIISADAS